MQEEIKSFVVRTLRDEMQIPLERTDDGTPLGADGWDLESLALVELTTRVEHEYGVSYPDEVFEQLAKATLGEFVADVSRRRAQASHPG
ncbi:acyl carrier protein [Micromonospora sp. KC721]|uniref:acyl carrier protein n=1 Tax=Micromonospora sp. KC721 TaxID=2530380 RepID=UPI001050A6D4|nr:acyl carrier protein [Micromonospora sp. KC721]TDB81877.1 acyl carrier protein [Micromonospora sp. KC721]